MQPVPAQFEREKKLVELREDDWRALRDVIESAEVPWGTWLVTRPDGTMVPLPVPPRQFLPFANAISEALNTRPSSKEEMPAEDVSSTEPDVVTANAGDYTVQTA